MIFKIHSNKVSWSENPLFYISAKEQEGSYHKYLHEDGTIHAGTVVHSTGQYNGYYDTVEKAQASINRYNDEHYDRVVIVMTSDETLDQYFVSEDEGWSVMETVAMQFPYSRYTECTETFLKLDEKLSKFEQLHIRKLSSF
jgi:hypothetical protein